MSCQHCHIDHKHKQVDKKFRIFNITRLIFAFLIVIISYIINFFVLKKIDDVTQKNIINYTILSLLVLSYILVSYDVLIKCVKKISKGKIFTESLLMIIATIGAFFVEATEEAVLVMFFYQIGEILEEFAEEKSKKSISKLINDMPLVAHLITTDSQSKILDVNPEELKVNDVIEIRAGEKIPVDGIVIKGESYLDLSSLNGESDLSSVSINSKVYSGSINKDGLIQIKVLKEYKDSTLTNILHLVENEESKKSKSENFISRFSKFYTPVVFFIALLYFFIPFAINNFLFNEKAVNYIKGALNLLLIACPCSLLISVPLAFFTSIGRASKFGSLIKGSYNLENLAKSNIFVFDKTGTLTKGDFTIVSDNNKINLLIANLLESKSNHPIANAFNSYTFDNELRTKYVLKTAENIPGKGAKGLINDTWYIIGELKLLSEYNISINTLDSASKLNQKENKLIYLASLSEKKLIDIFVISDNLKETTYEAINILKNDFAIKTHILSGDTKDKVEAIKDSLNIDVAHYQLLPEEKLNKLENIKKENPKSIITYIGDGINDAPSLLYSDVGIAMGGLGSDVAKESSNIVILNDDLLTVCETIRLSKHTMKIVYLNIFLILSIKLCVMILTLPIFNFQSYNWWMIISILSDVGLLIISILISMTNLLYKTKYMKQRFN